MKNEVGIKILVAVLIIALGFGMYACVNSCGSSSSSNSNSISSKITCPSCGRKVNSLISRKDKAGVTRNWCSSCWADYNDIMN